MNKSNLIIVIPIVLLGILALWGLSSRQKASLGGTADGLVSIIDSQTTDEVGFEEIVTLFATSTSNCVGRSIGTSDGPIKISFTDKTGQTPSALLGFPQAASTTVFYDASQYGCGKVRAYGYASTTVILSESI